MSARLPPMTYREARELEFRDQMIEQMVEALFIRHQKGEIVEVPRIIMINGEPYDVSFHLGMG